MIDEVILIEPILKNKIVFEAPFKMATGGPTGYVALSHGKAFFLKGGAEEEASVQIGPHRDQRRHEVEQTWTPIPRPTGSTEA